MRKFFFITMSLVLILSLVGTPAVAQDTGSPNPPAVELAEHVPGEILIRFSPGLSSAQATDRMAEMGLSHKRQIEALSIHLVTLPPGLSVEQAIARFSHLPGVEFVEPNYILHIESTLHAESTEQWALSKIQIPEAWNQLDGAHRNTVLLATVDSGVDRNRSDLSNQIWTNPDEDPNTVIDDDLNGYINDTWGWDFVNNDNDPMDDNMHGTAVSSIMVADDDGIGMVGMCPWCQIMAVKVIGSDGSGTLDNVAKGIVYAADNGARVINLSLGAASGAQTLQDAVSYAWNKKVVVVAAAGNGGTNSVMYPAAYPNAMAVASTNSADQHSCFSNYSEGYISVAAPGEAVYVIDINSASGYGTYSGTSLSTPHVSGLAGLLLGQDPGLTNQGVRDIIEDSAVDLGQPGIDPVFGHGRIDAYRAVIRDNSQVTPPDSLSSTNDSATGFPHARKLVRDNTGKLHAIWHTFDGSLYRVRYATSGDNGSSWDLQPDAFSSPYESYHSALATDGTYLYVAIPSRKGVNLPYQIFFTRKLIAGGTWEAAKVIISGNYDAVRPTLFFDPTNSRLHVLASSLDNSPNLYYTASGNQGVNWSNAISFNASSSTNMTREAAFYANGNNLYAVTRTVENFFIYNYLNIWVVQSTNGGQSWGAPEQIAANMPWLTGGNYGISLAGVGNRIYMGYVVGFDLYFRRNDGAGWGGQQGYLTLETSDGSNPYRWPSITQSADGKAWLLVELAGQLYKRYYDGTTWQPKEKIGPGTYPALKLGTSADRVEWVYTTCNGTPFGLGYGSIDLNANPNRPPVANPDSAATAEDTPVSISVKDNDTDPDGDALSIVSNTQPAHGTVVSNPQGSLTYTPASNYNGPDSFNYTISDGKGGTASATVALSVTPVNDVPVAFDDSVTTVEGNPITFPVLNNDSDVDNDVLTVSNYTQPMHGDVTLNTDYSFTYSPDVSYIGVDIFNYTASDGKGGVATATVTLSVTSIEPPPQSIHVGNLVPSIMSGSKNTWVATVKVTAHDSAHAPVPGVTVTGTWSAGATGTATCQTDLNGECSIDKTNLKSTVTSVMLTIDKLSIDEIAYDSDQNHDIVKDSYAGTAITVYKNGPPANYPPLAKFTYACNVLSCSFNASASADVEGYITNYMWDFGDGNTGGNEITNHTYNGEGTYTVKLTVYDDKGGSSSSSQQIYAGAIQVMHVGDLEGSSGLGTRNRWNATVTILVHNASGSPVTGVTVSGTWGTVSGACTTLADGKCDITLSNISSKTTSVGFSVMSLTKTGWKYEPMNNKDADNDTNGTYITIPQP